MQDPLLFSQARKPENTAEARKSGGFFRHLAQVWLDTSSPNRERFDSSLADQERLRRSHLLSKIFLLILVAAGIILPTVIPTSLYLIPVSSLILLSLLALILNRMALITLSGIVVLCAIDMALTILMIILPNGIRNTNVPDFSLFLISILIGGIVLPRRLLPYLAGFHIVLIFLLFTQLPHDTLLNQEMHSSGQGWYGELSDAFLLQVIGAAIAWLNARSVDKALARANMAEELARAHERLNAYIQWQIKQKERVEYGISVLREAHARFANGDYKARANLQNNELSSLALSFNLLAERLNRITKIATDHVRLEQAFQQLFTIHDTLIQRKLLQPFVPTGTLVDQVYPWLKQLDQLRQTSSHCSESVELMRPMLLQQKHLLTQMTSALTQTYTEAQLLARDTTAFSFVVKEVKRAQDCCQQVEDQGKRFLQIVKQMEHLSKIST